MSADKPKVEISVEIKQRIAENLRACQHGSALRQGDRYVCFWCLKDLGPAAT